MPNKDERVSVADVATAPLTSGQVILAALQLVAPQGIAVGAMLASLIGSAISNRQAERLLAVLVELTDRAKDRGLVPGPYHSSEEFDTVATALIGSIVRSHRSEKVRAAKEFLWNEIERPNLAPFDLKEAYLRTLESLDVVDLKLLSALSRSPLTGASIKASLANQFPEELLITSLLRLCTLAIVGSETALLVGDTSLEGVVDHTFTLSGFGGMFVAHCAIGTLG